ncbi:MAG TPA: hypothetical protein VM240_09455 [Verrucomicrobiae bacterium]|nr:hypothetical protein [Verrucomicrobiae bacterium]
MLLRNPRFMAFLLVAAGLGVAGYFGEQRSRLPEWSEAEIEQSVELNLTLDLSRRGPHLQPDGERMDALRTAVRAEVEADIKRDREHLERWIGVGLVLLVLGVGQFVFSAAFRQKSD